MPKKVKAYILIIEIDPPFLPLGSQNASHLALSVRQTRNAIFGNSTGPSANI